MILLNGETIDPTIFPDNTSQVWKLENYKKVNNIRWIFESEEEIIHLHQLVSLLNNENSIVNLYMNYLPYARQDKNIDNNSTFALHSLAAILNTLKFNSIQALDVHSDVAIKLINGLKNVEPNNFINEAICYTDCELICYPDAGAAKRYTIDMPNVYAQKERNQLTGEIEKITLSGDCTGKNVLIVDDICDGGATFIKLASILYSNGANNVSLYVTHALCTKGVKVLQKAKINVLYSKNGVYYDINNAYV